MKTQPINIPQMKTNIAFIIFMMLLSLLIIFGKAKPQRPSFQSHNKLESAHISQSLK